MKKTKWGIVGTGNISSQFADGLQHVEGAEIYAVASRSRDTAQAFAGRYGIAKAYGSYEEMAKDDDIDIVYIGTPHTAHLENAIMFMEAGRAVLCDKPLGVSVAEVKAMVQKARERDVFFMEGIWTRFFPAVRKALEWVKEGRIGTPKTLFANFGYDGSRNRDQWRFKREMAGGAMLDVGIYPLSFAFAAFGTDYATASGAAIINEGIDEVNSFTLQYPDGRIAAMGSGIAAWLDNRAVITGTEGCVVLGEGGDPWWHASRAALRFPATDLLAGAGGVELFDMPYPSTGFQYEAAAVQQYVAQGLKEAPEIPLDESVKIAETMEKLLRMWGVEYDAFKV
jgi:predicted dehydrogenase